VNKYILYNIIGVRKATAFCTRYITAQLSFPGVKRPDLKFNHQPPANSEIEEIVEVCHHGMARPQVADGGTASDMEGSCE
jgi:hypothetical protein